MKKENDFKAIDVIDVIEELKNYQNNNERKDIDKLKEVLENWANQVDK